jgi:hypothetical protein
MTGHGGRFGMLQGAVHEWTTIDDDQVHETRSREISDGKRSRSSVGHRARRRVSRMLPHRESRVQEKP